MVDWAYVNGMGDDEGDPDHDIHDPQGHCGGARSHVYGPPLVCRHCGSSNVFWQKVNNRKTEYVMHDIDSLAEHRCLDKPSTPEGFDDV